jgi:hypothetical protein
LRVDTKSLGRAARVQQGPIATQPWAQDGAGVSLRVRGYRIRQWHEVHGDCGPLPPAPIPHDASPEILTLIPFGCARLRIAMFPRL